MVDNNERSPLWGFAVGSAILGGAALTGSRSYGAIRSTLTKPSGSIIDVAISAAAKASPFNTGRLVPEVVQGQIANLPNANIGRTIHQYAYESLMSTGRVSHLEAVTALSDIAKQSTNLDAYRLAADVVTRYKGNIGILNNNINTIAKNPFQIESIFKNSVFAENAFGAQGPKSLSFADLGNIFGESAQNAYTTTLQNIQAANVSGVKIKPSIYSVSDTFAGQTVNTPILSLGIGNTNYNIPLTDSPFNYEGKNLTTRYIGRGGYRDASGELMSFRQIKEESLINALANSKNEHILGKNIHKVQQVIIDNLNSSKSTKAALWTMPEPMLTAGGRARTRISMQELINYGDVSEDSLPGLFNKGLFPYTSPDAAAKGTLTKGNLAERLFGPMGRLISPEQRPTQFIRSEWGVTSAAKEIASSKLFNNTFGQYFDRLNRKIQGEDYAKLMYGKYSSYSAEAYTAPQLMTFYAKPSSSNYELGFKSKELRDLMSAEETVISRQAREMMEYERVIQKKIQVGDGFRINKDILGSLTNNEGLSKLNIGEGSFVGIESGSGKSILLSENANKYQTVIGAEMTADNMANVYIRERVRLSEGERFKGFSEENKFMSRLAQSDEEFKRIAAASGLNPNEYNLIGGQRIEKIASGKLVGRNQFALLNQQIEAMGIFAGNKIDSTTRNTLRKNIRNREIQSFLSNPEEYLKVSSLMSSTDEDAALAIQKNLVGLAKGWGFNKREMQLTFGLMDRGNIKSLIGSGVLSAREGANIAMSPGVVGLSKEFLGHLASGDWGRGSLEPTGFRVLASKDIKFAVEMSKRVVGAGNLASIGRMEESVLGQESFINRFKRGDLPNFAAADNLLLDKGQYMSLGRSFKELGGSNTIYIPGVNEADDFMSPSFPRGEQIDSPLMQEIKSFQSALKRGLPEDELENAASSLRSAVLAESERQARSKGKIIGSSLNTAVEGKIGDTWGISRQSATLMFEDLKKRATTTYQKDFLEEQYQSLMKGGTLTGSVWRHPTTGPQSLQFVNYKIDEDLAEGILSVPRRRGKMNIGGKISDINMSEMIGMQGDFDRDQLVLAAISNRDTATRVSKRMIHGQDSEYINFLFNHYTLNDLAKNNITKKEVLDMRTTEGIYQGYRKLTTAKSTTGQVNIALQKFKLGMQYAAPEEYKPLSLLFQHMEQAAIGGKHGVLGSDLYQTIAQSAERGGEEGRRMLKSAMVSIFGTDKVNMSGSITNQFGETFNNLSATMDLDDLSDKAMRAYGSVSDEVDVAMRAARIAKGTNATEASLSQATEQFFARRRGGIDVAQALMQGGSGFAQDFESKASRHVRRGLSKASEILSIIKKNKMPLIAGAATAAGLMLAAPSISGVVPSGGKAARGIDPQEMGSMPQSNNAGMIPPPGRMNASPRVYDIGSSKPTYRANIRTRVNDLNSSRFIRDANSMGGNSNVRTQDDRAVLNPRMLAKKIHERL